MIYNTCLINRSY